MNKAEEYLKKAGLSEKETKIYLILFKNWTQPASVVSRLVGIERVSTYKILLKLVEKWIILETTRKSVKHFWIPSVDLLEQYVEKQELKRGELKYQFDYIKTEFQEIKPTHISNAPKLAIYQWKNQIQNIFTDIKKTIDNEQLLSIQFFWTNTFQEQISSSETTQKLMNNFNDYLKSKKINIESTTAEWWLVMEQLFTQSWSSEIIDLPAGNNATNIFVVGKTLYIIIYKNTPIGIRLESPEVTRAFSFLLKKKQPTSTS